MFTSEAGIRLMLWTGSTIPTPPKPGVIAALTRVQVTNDEDSGDGFQLTFALGHDGVADWDLLDGSLAPMTRVWIAVVLGIVPEVLIDGIITQHTITPSNEPGRSTLTVTGTNLSVMLDLEEKNDPKKNQPDFVIVGILLAGYGKYGLLPAVSPTTSVPIELQRIPRQRETDLACIRRLAGDNGYVFYIEPITFGVNKAYWGPVVRAGLPQPALSMNMGASTNVTELSFSNDALAPVSASGGFVEPITKMVVPIPALPPLRVPPLALFPATPQRKVLLRESANEDPAQAALSSASAATEAAEAVSGQGQLETVRYGSVLRARRLVGVRGSGFSYDGVFYVKSVTHEITKGSYTQSFRLARDGTGSLLPMVPT
ncbi:MAG TPA: hypothetical protein VGJ71_03455 [Candidatus Limnocylindrales bacterium]